MIPTYAQLQTEVNQIKETEKFSIDLKKNINVIRKKMINHFESPFAIYDGGNSQLMMKTLHEHGYTVEQNGEALYVQLFIHNPITHQEDNK